MAVYTSISKDALEDHLAAFDIGRLVSFEPVAEGVENSNYFIKTDRDKYVLTLFEKRVVPEELPFYLGFMEYVRSHGIPAPRVLAARQGGSVLSLKGKPSIITEFLKGNWPRRITPSHAAAVGEKLAQMHALGRKFPMKRANTMSYPAWKSLIHACRDGADRLESGLFAFLDAELEDIGKNWPKYLPRGAIHADLFPDNVFFDSDKIFGIIDFYFACSDTLAYDLMLTFNAWCFDKDSGLDQDRARVFLEAYQKTRPLTRGELKSLPFFGRASALRIVATRLYDLLNPVADAIVTPKDPMEYIRILRFHRQIRALADYGFRL